MSFLEAEWAAVDRLLPDLSDSLRAQADDPPETAGMPVKEFVRSGGAGLLVPDDLGGLGASALEGARVQRAIGSAVPALAVATTMHHFSVATLVEMIGTGLESILVEGIARGPLLVASGFAEGSGRNSMLKPSMSGVERDGRLVLSGTKKPCSLASSMDLLAVSADVGGRLAVVLVPAELPGIRVEPFWTNPALQGAETCAVTLTSVEVPMTLVSYASSQCELDAVQQRSLAWFELLISASYLGVASALVADAIAKCGDRVERVFGAGASCEQAMASLESVANTLDRGEQGDALLARALLVRYVVQDLVMSAADVAAEVLGGTAFAVSERTTLLLASCRALAFHPPRRDAVDARLVGWMRGQPLRLGDI